MATTDKNMTFDVNLLPVTTGDHNLGNSTLKWNLYVNQINGHNPDLVKQTNVANDLKYKLLTTTSTSPTTGSAAETYYSDYITANPSTGSISAKRHTLNFNGTDKVYMIWNNTDQSIDFIFE